MKTCLVHFCLVDDFLLSSLSLNGYLVSCVSIPAFARSDNDLDIIKKYNPDCLIFDIASWLSIAPIKSTFYADTLDVPIMHSLLCQSLRMSVYDSLNYYERYLIINSIFQYSLSFLSDNHIDLLVFGGCPHSVADSCLMEAARSLNITVFFLQDKPIAPFSSFVYNSRYELVDASSTQRDIAAYNKLVDTVCNHYSSYGTPFVDTKGSDSKSSSWKTIYRKTEEPLSSRLAKLSVSVENQKLLQDSADYLNQWNSRATAAIEDVWLDRQVVTYYMHVEPEAAVNPFAGPENVFQVSSILNLRNRLDPAIPLLIKEHPAMFLCSYIRKNIYKDYRPSHLLETISKLPNTYLIHTDQPSQDIISASSCVAALSGSIIHDYVLSRKPAFMHKSSHAYFGLESHDIESSVPITTDLIHDATVRLRQHTTRDIIDSWLRPSIPGSPNAHLNMFRDLSSPQLRSRNSISLGLSIHALRTQLFPSRLSNDT